VVAESQSLGRGRLGRAWASPAEGGLYFSLVLRPALALSEAPQITLLAGAGVCRAINALTHVGSGIKWPNDILVQGKKVAGILTEIEAEMNRIHHLIVGIGVNVNTRLSELPHSLRGRATSLREETGQNVSRQSLLALALAEMEILWREAQGRGFGPVREAWKRLNCTLGQRVRIQGTGRSWVGTAADLDDQGALLVRADGGSFERIAFGEVALLKADA
jgi:BirA family biotin operon repressor/biotin-[acetyl-CoA-carboxylase] ligase